MGRPRRYPCAWGWIEDDRGRYRLRGRYLGKPRSIGTYDTLEEAQQRAQAIADELSGRVADARLPIGPWVLEWLERRERARRHRSVRDQRAVWLRYGADDPIADLGVGDLRERHARQWVSRLEGRDAQGGRRAGEPLSARTIRNALQVLSQAMEAAAEAGHRSGNPCRGIRVRDVATTVEPWTYLTTAEIAQLLGHSELPQRQRAIYTVAIYTGLRAGEMWGLRWEDVHLGDRPRLIVRHGSGSGAPTKGGRVREVPLLPPAVDALEEWRQRDGVTRATGLVWTGERGPHGRGYDAGWRRRSERVAGVRSALPGWREVCGIRPEVRLHDLRHTCGAHLVSGSWGRAWRLEEVQRMLGHRSRTTTERYAHLAPGALHDAAEEARAAWRGTAAPQSPAKRVSPRNHWAAQRFPKP